MWTWKQFKEKAGQAWKSATESASDAVQAAEDLARRIDYADIQKKTADTLEGVSGEIKKRAGETFTELRANMADSWKAMRADASHIAHTIQPGEVLERAQESLADSWETMERDASHIVQISEDLLASSRLQESVSSLVQKIKPSETLQNQARESLEQLRGQLTDSWAAIKDDAIHAAQSLQVRERLGTLPDSLRKSWQAMAEDADHLALSAKTMTGDMENYYAKFKENLVSVIGHPSSIALTSATEIILPTNTPPDHIEISAETFDERWENATRNTSTVGRADEEYRSMALAAELAKRSSASGIDTSEIVTAEYSGTGGFAKYFEERGAESQLTAQELNPPLTVTPLISTTDPFPVNPGAHVLSRELSDIPYPAASDQVLAMGRIISKEQGSFGPRTLEDAYTIYRREFANEPPSLKALFTATDRYKQFCAENDINPRHRYDLSKPGEMGDMLTNLHRLISPTGTISDETRAIIRATVAPSASGTAANIFPIDPKSSARTFELSNAPATSPEIQVSTMSRVLREGSHSLSGRITLGEANRLYNMRMVERHSDGWFSREGQEKLKQYGFKHGISPDHKFDISKPDELKIILGHLHRAIDPQEKLTAQERDIIDRVVDQQTQHHHQPRIPELASPALAPMS